MEVLEYTLKQGAKVGSRIRNLRTAFKYPPKKYNIEFLKICFLIISKSSCILFVMTKSTDKKSRAFISDPHACALELKIAYDWAISMGVLPENILALGDLEDRGPNPGECTRMVKSLMGNHCRALVELAKDRASGKILTFKPGREYKKVSLEALTEKDIQTLSNLPAMLYFEEYNLIAVHAGLSPYLPWFKQNHLVDHVQLVHPFKPKESLWWGDKTVIKYKKTEKQLISEGWNRWYEVHDQPYDVVFGHSVFTDGPLIKRVAGQRLFGLDTGCVYGGYLTVMVMQPDGTPVFAHVKTREKYFTENDHSYDFSNFKPVGIVL
jgi:hypothetical protein